MIQAQNGTLQNSTQTLWYVTKQYVHYTTVFYTIFKTVKFTNSIKSVDIEEKSTSPMDWLDARPYLNLPWIWSVTTNRTPSTHGLARALSLT
jgi:hypothetical protein